MKKIFLSLLFIGSFILQETMANSLVKLSKLAENDDVKVISYLDEFSYELGDHFSWSIMNSGTGSIIKSGTGSIMNFKFPKPGSYAVSITDNVKHATTECNHNNIPSKLIVKVEPMKLAFDFASIKFKNEIYGGQSQDDNTLTVDVLFSNSTNTPVEFNEASFKSSGIGTSLTGKLLNDKTSLTPGLNHLVYKLSGHVTSDTYIMLDFIDINNQVITYYAPTKIK